MLFGHFPFGTICFSVTSLSVPHAFLSLLFLYCMLFCHFPFCTSCFSVTSLSVPHAFLTLPFLYRMLFCHFPFCTTCFSVTSLSVPHAFLLLPFLYLMDECIEWQVNYGYQKCHEFLIRIQNKHQNLTISLSSIHDQNTIFIQISHIAKSHTHKSLFGSTQTINPSIQCIYCQFNYWFYNSWTFMIENKDKVLKTIIFCIIKCLFSLVFTQTSHICKITHSQIHNWNWVVDSGFRPGVVLPPGVNSEITKSIIENLQICIYAMRMHVAAPAALACT